MFENIVMWQFDKSDFDPEVWERIQGASTKIVHVNSTDELKKELPYADALLIKLGHVVNRELIDLSPKLKYISIFGTDTSRIDEQYANENDIIVNNVAGYSTGAVAEFAISLILDHYREISRAKFQASKGNYTNEGFLGREIKGRTLGILGLGKIGEQVSTLAAAFGAKVLYYDRLRKKNLEGQGVRFLDLDELLARSDVISLNLPLTSETEGILNAERIGRFKDGSLFLILAPIELLDFEAALSRDLRGEITIVLNHSYELSQDQISQLRECENCIMLPPISFLTEESRRLRQQLFVTGVENAAQGLL